eukprot:1054488_1
MFVFIILSSLQLFVRFANGCGFVEYFNGTYAPLNACFNYRNFDESWSFSCYGNQLYMIEYDTSDCVGIILSNITTFKYNYQCDNTNTCDYIQYGLYPADVGGIDCNALGEAPYSLADVINYCYFDRKTGLYKMDTCTDTVSTTFYYTDALCSGDPSSFLQLDHCDHGSSNTYFEIETCTTPMNHVADKCGYVQYRKDSVVRPLDVCVESDTLSYMWTCHSSRPFLYYWMGSQCGDLSIMDGNISEIPIAYSCAANPCNQAHLTTYQTSEPTNCNVASDITSSITIPFIIDTCINLFNVNNVMVSTQYFCVEEDHQISLYGVVYGKPNCDDSQGSQVFLHYTDQCVENADEQYLIQCHDLLPNTTETPIITSSTTQTNASSPAPTFEELKDEHVLYVTSTADGSCLFDWTCGTLYSAISAASVLVGNNSINKVEIIVQGQNAEEIKKANGINPCIPEVFVQPAILFTEITITFDTDHIHEMKDWYNTDLCESYHSSGFFSQRQGGSLPFSLIINNMIFDSYIFEGRSNQPFYIINVHQFTCNYCVFRNITIRSNHYTLDKLYKYTDSSHYPTLISSAVIDLHQCEFEDIAYEIFANGIDVYRYSFIQVRLVPTQHYGTTFSLTMSNHTVVANITHLYRFIDVIYQIYTKSVGSVVPDGEIVINDVAFTDITVFDSIITHGGDVRNRISNVSITNTNVRHLALGSIFRAKNTESFIEISNVNISTSQTIQHNLNTKQSYGISTLDRYYSLFVFESTLDIVSIQHVNVEYIYGYYLAENCKSDDSILSLYLGWNQFEQALGKDLDFVYMPVNCHVPMEFMHSVADVDILHLTVSNDITDTLMASFKSFIVNAFHSMPLTKQDTVYVHFTYSDGTAFIYNEYGALNVEYLTVYGLGVHETIIHSPEGDLSVNQLMAVPETYCTFIPCEYDRDSLQIATWIHFGGGESNKCTAATLAVSNSYIYGSESHAIVVGVGYAYLHNVTIHMTAGGINTDANCMYLEIIECNMMDIGSYYASSGAFLSAHSNLRVPFALVPSELLIRDSVFSFVGPHQFVMFGTASYFETETGGRRKITLINNLFEINDQNVVTPYLTNHTLQYLADIDLYSALNTINYTIDVDASKHFVVNGTMHIESEMDVMMMDNEFRVNPNNLYVSQSVLMDYNLPWIYATNNDDGTNSICMSGNEFTGFAIYAKHANITSCVRTQLLDYFSTVGCDSYGTFGAASSSFTNLVIHPQPSVFNVNDDELLSILMAEYDSYIALDNIRINIFDTANNATPILDIFEGNYLLVDTIINTTTEYDIKANENCDIPCYSTVSGNVDAMSIFHVMCDSDMSDAALDTVSIHEIYDVYQRSHWSPHLMYIDPHNNGLYVPGNKLLFNYSIHDVYGNPIDIVKQELVVNFQSVDSSELDVSFKLVIDETGFCAECVNGISFPGFTIDMADEVYSFSGLVTNNNVRIEQPVNVTVDRCPSGYGATGTNQCDVCSIGYFNLMSTNDSCYYCDDNALDGITCPGSNHIIMDHNYWVSAYQYNDAVDDIFASTYVVSSKCPSSYCCQLSQGCDLLSNASSLCAPNRDSKTYLCGSCVDGFSEAVGTTKCMECHRGYPLLLLIPITYGLAWAMFILVTKRSPKPIYETPEAEKDQTSCCKKKNDDIEYDRSTLSRKEYLDCLEIMMSKIILYHYQSVSYILTTSGVQSSLYGFAELSNLNVFQFLSVGSSTDSDGYCIFENMSAPQTISVQLVATASILLFILIAFMCSLCCSTKTKNSLRIHFPQCFIKAMLVCVGQILSVLFQLVACRQIASGIVVHFFFGDHKCYEWLWILCIVSLTIVFVSFCVLFLSIYMHRKKLKPDDDNFKHMYYYPVSWSYSDQYWFWEAILFVRRSVFAFVFIVFDNNNLKMGIGILSIIYLYIHTFAHPFKAKDVNLLESYLMGTTALIIFIDAGNSDILFQNITISLLILFPLVWFMYFVVSRRNSLANRTSAVAHQWHDLKTSVVAYNSDVIDDEHSENTIELCGDPLTRIKSNVPPRFIAQKQISFSLADVVDSSNP